MRNYSLDILKFLCAVLVVLLHIKTPWTEYILPITRAAVPCFFIISGYFLYQEDEQSLQRIKRSFVKVGTILLWSSVLYALFKLITTSINISYRDIIDFVLFNVNPFGYHLWYLSAYMYVLVIFYICVKEHVVNLLFIVSPLLLLADLILGKYSLLTLGIELNYIYIRNFLFVGIPYFSIGVFIKKKVRYNNGNICAYKYLFLGGVVLFSLTSLFERYLLENYGINATRDHYISTTLLSICLFLLAISFSQMRSSVWVLLGAKYSLYIYVLHPLVDYCFKYLNKMLMPHCWNQYYYYYGAPFIILISTIMMIEGCLCVQEKLYLNVGKKRKYK